MLFGRWPNKTMAGLLACNTGGNGCENYTKFDMTLVEPTPEDQAKVTAATMDKVLPGWAESCNAGYADLAPLKYGMLL